jgi:hypothetical protein
MDQSVSNVMSREMIVIASPMLELLHEHEISNFEEMVTEDESWFQYDYAPREMDVGPEKMTF